MGLFAVITGDDLGLPTELSGTAIVPVDSDGNGEDDVMWNNETTTVTVQVDYSDAFAAFAESFYLIALDLVPIDTGYLLSSISSSSDDWSMTAEAEAYYAQYVQFGTWKMAAQPYFIPALNMAWEEAAPLFEQALASAQQDLDNQIAAIQEDLGDNSDTGFGGGLGGFLGILLGAAVMGIIQGFLNYLGSAGSSSGGSFRGGSISGGDFDSFVEIT